MVVGGVSVPLKYVHVCMFMCVRSAYRAVVDPLVNISELALPDAAAQIYPVPLDLVVPRWERGVEEEMGKGVRLSSLSVLEKWKKNKIIGERNGRTSAGPN